MSREPVPVKCVDCGAERVVSASELSGAECYWCDGRMITRGNAGQVVTLLGYSENGRFYPAPSNPWFRHTKKRKKTVKPKHRSRWRSDTRDLPPKPKYTNQPRESVAKKPEVKLAPIRDHSHSQAWRNSSGEV